MTNFSIDNPDRRLEIDETRYKLLLQQIEPLLLRHISQIAQQNVVDMHGIDSFKQYYSKESLPHEPTALSEIINDCFYDAMTKGYRSYTGGYMADIPGGGLLHSSLGDILTSVFNRWPGLFEWAPGLLEIEKITIKWLCNIMGLPENSGGIFTSGGSMANMNAIFVARVYRFPNSFEKGVIYVSDQAHHSICKSAYMTGISKDRIKIIPSDEAGALILSNLIKQIDSDVSNNLIPFLVIGNAGSTRIGSCDDLMALSKVAQKYSCWFHVDAAWAGSFNLTQRGKNVMQGIETADSITLDPHKAFWTPWGSGTLLVKKPELLEKAFGIDADYLPFEDADDLMLNPSNISGELSRNARGLQLWLPFKLCGIEIFKHYLDEKLDLAEFAEKQLESLENVQIMHRPKLGILSFRINIIGKSQAQLNELNKHVLNKINEDCSIFISGTEIHGNYLIRIAPLNFRTHKSHVEKLIHKIKQVIRQVITS